MLHIPLQDTTFLSSTIRSCCNNYRQALILAVALLSEDFSKAAFTPSKKKPGEKMAGETEWEASRYEGRDSAHLIPYSRILDCRKDVLSVCIHWQKIHFFGLYRITNRVYGQIQLLNLPVYEHDPFSIHALQKGKLLVQHLISFSIYEERFSKILVTEKNSKKSE